MTDPFEAGGPFDREDPRSLISIMPREARATLDETPALWLTMDEHEIVKLVKPTPLLQQIRSAFWLEYDAAQSTHTKMTLKGVILHMGSSSPSLLVKDALTNTKKLAFILHPPLHYDTLIAESLSHGLRRIQEILDLPLVDQDGKIDHKSAELILKATAFLDIRKNGMPTQRTEMKQLTVNVTKKDLAALNGHKPHELDQKIRQLEAELGKAPADG